MCKFELIAIYWLYKEKAKIKSKLIVHIYLIYNCTTIIVLFVMENLNSESKYFKIFLLENIFFRNY